MIRSYDPKGPGNSHPRNSRPRDNRPPSGSGGNKGISCPLKLLAVIAVPLLAVWGAVDAIRAATS